MQYTNLTLAGVKKLAVSLRKPDKLRSKPPRIFGLTGPLGAGKTTFTKSLAETIGIKNAKSPTFTIVHCYEGPEKSLYHIDLYRLENEKELASLGLEEILEDEGNLVAIEWVDKFPKLMDQCDCLLNFEITKDNKRNVTVTHN